MKRKYRQKSSSRKSRRTAPRKIARQAEEQARLLQLPLSVEGLLIEAELSLHNFAVELGVQVAQALLEDEVTQRCGPRYQRSARRQETRYGHQHGYIVLSGQKLPVRKPRVRRADGGDEVELQNYKLLQNPNALPQASLKHLINGVSCRRYEAVVDLAREGFGVKRSSVSRGFVRASAADVEQLAKRRFDDHSFVAIYIDGVAYGGEMMIVALGITASGDKMLLGFRQGATENAEVCASLLEELREQGVKTNAPTLFVLDGAKALHAAVQRVFGKYAVIQRCQIHKRRNVEAHVPPEHHAELRRRLNEAWHEDDEARARQSLQETIKWLRRLSPAAARSLEEGWEETLTAVRLQVPELLRKTLSTTNPIESALSVSQSVTRRVKRWRDGDMRERWCVAGLLDAESRFNRVKGHRQIPSLQTSLQREIDARKVDKDCAKS